MNRNFNYVAGFVLALAVSPVFAQQSTAPSAVELSVQLKKLEADTKKQLEAALAKKQDAEAALKAAEEKKKSAPATAAPAPSATAAKPTAKATVSTPTPVGVITAGDAKQLSTLATRGGVSAIDVKGMDLETAMLKVQTERANLLESQLKDRLSAIQAANGRIEKMNVALKAALSMAAQFPSSAKSTASTKETVKTADLAAWEKAAKDADVKSIDISTKAGVDAQAQAIKSQIDSLSNTQQMDMLKLQSQANKRNEAFETMTNFIKKMQDSRASALGKMR